MTGVWVTEHRFPGLQHERNDGLAILRVVLEFGTIVLVFTQSPNGHLIETGEGEQESGNALGHDGERHPGSDLVGVVGARDETKDE